MGSRTPLVAALVLATTLGLAFGWLQSKSTSGGYTNALIQETRRPSGMPPRDIWLGSETEMILALTAALEGNESIHSRRSRELREWLTRRGWPLGAPSPSPAELRCAAVRIVLQQGPKATWAVAPLTHALQRTPLGDSGEAEQLELALAKLGPAAAPARSLLVARATASPADFNAARALRQIGAPRETWQTLARHPNAAIRWAGEVGELEAEQPAEALKRLISMEASSESAQAWLLIEDTGSNALPILPQVAFKLRDAAPKTRVSAAKVLASLGPGAASPLASVLETEPELEVRLAIIRSLGELGSSASLATNILQHLQHGDQEEQIEAARTALDRIQKDL